MRPLSLRRFASISFLVLLAVPRPAPAWQSHLPANTGESAAYAVAFGADGSVVAAGIDHQGGDIGYATVEKLTSDGTLVWRRTIDGVGSVTRSVAVDPNGDVLIGGLAGGLDESDQGHFTAVKLDGDTGTELWRHEPTDTFEGGMVVDRAGNALIHLVVLVNVGGPDENYGWICRKLAASDGSVLWQNDDCSNVATVDADGDLFLRAYPFVGKLSGEDGHEIWRSTEILASGPSALDGAGNLVVTARADVAKLAGSDGTVLWRSTQRDFDAQIYGIAGVAVDPHDDVVAIGSTPYRSGKGMDVLVRKLDGQSGRRRWRHRIDFRNPDFRGSYDRGKAVRIDAAGDVLLCGEGDRGYANGRIIVRKLKGKSGRALWTQYPQGVGGQCWALAVDADGASAVAGGIGPVAAAVDAGTFFVTRLGPAGDGTSPLLVQ